MYFQIGSNTIIRSEEIIGIFEISKKYDLVEKISHPRDRKMEVKDLTKNGNHATCIITDHVLYLSSISVPTLVKRFKAKFWINEEEFKDIR
jgi:hypothetical protein